jgi:hypothetical protein
MDLKLPHLGEGADSGTVVSLFVKVGDSIWVYDGRGLRQEPITSLARIGGRTRVYNLRTDEPHTYFASGVAVHNKGGGGGGRPHLATAGGKDVSKLDETLSQASAVVKSMLSA